MAVTSGAAIRHAVQDIIDADLSLAEIRSAVMSLIPEEYHWPSDLVPAWAVSGDLMREQ